MTFPEWVRHMMLDEEWRIEAGRERLAALADNDQAATTLRIVGPDEDEEPQN